MDVSVETTSDLGRRLKIRVPQTEIADQYTEKMKKLSKEANLKGFRPGKVPTHVLQKKFGASVRSEIISEAIQKSLTDALTEHALKPAGMPEIDGLNDQQDADLEYTASFEIYPTVELKDLSQVKVEKRTAVITEADVEQTIDKMCHNFATWHEVSRAAQANDRLLVDFERHITGLDEAPQSQQNIELELDREGILPELPAALVGKQAQEQVSIEVQYPETWEDERIAGKQATLKVSIHQVQAREVLTKAALSEKIHPNQEFDEAKLQQQVREKLERELAQTIQNGIKENVLAALMEQHPLELPKALVEQELKTIEEEMQRQANNVDYPDYYSAATLKDMAEKRVVLGLLVNAVIQNKAIQVDKQLVRAEIERQASAYPNAAEIVNAYYGHKELLAGVERQVLLDQAVNALLDEMQVEEKTLSFDELMHAPKNNEAKS
jgi:trigger factor